MNMLLGVKTGIAWLDTLVAAVMNVINPILILVAVAGIVYSIVVGVKFVVPVVDVESTGFAIAVVLVNH